MFFGDLEALGSCQAGEDRRLWAGQGARPQGKAGPKAIEWRRGYVALYGSRSGAV